MSIQSVGPARPELEELSTVVTFFVVLAILNFALGFLLAIVMEDVDGYLHGLRSLVARVWDQFRILLERIPLPRLRLPRIGLPQLPTWLTNWRLPMRAPEVPALEAEIQPKRARSWAAGLPAAPAAEAESEVSANVPQDWQQALQSATLDSEALLEAALLVLTINLNRCRQELLDQEAELRGIGVPNHMACCVELRNIAERWLSRQSEVAEHLARCKRHFSSDDQAIADELEQFLLDKAAELGVSITNLQLQELDDESSSPDVILSELYAMTKVLHETRDLVQQYLVAVAPESFDSKVLPRCGVTLEIPDRFAAAELLEQWANPSGREPRLASFSLIRVDNFQEINERFGTAAADQILVKVGEVIQQNLRKKRGSDRLVHLSGPRFSICFGDTAVHNGARGADRIRQLLQAVTFRWQEEEVRLTVSCAVREVRRGDKPLPFFRRLERVLEDSEKLGGNCTVVDEGHTILALQSPTISAEAKMVEIS